MTTFTATRYVHLGQASPGQCGLLRRGFTLIELLVVISIIAILVTLVVPTFFRARLLAKNARVASRVDELSQGCGLYRADYNYYPGQQYMYEWLDTKDYTGSQVLAASLFRYSLCTTDTITPDSSSYASCNVGSGSTKPDIVGASTVYSASDQIGSKPLGLMNYIWDRYDENYLPIIYYPSRIGVSSMLNTGTDVAAAAESTYSYFHNEMHTASVPKAVVPDKRTQPAHQSNVLTQYTTPAETPPSGEYDYISFRDFIANTKIDPSSATPYRVDEYLIIAPGMDRIFGSGDDLTNFKVK